MTSLPKSTLAVDKLVLKLERHGRSLSAPEIEALAGVVSQVIEVGPGVDFVREHERKMESNLLVDGWACRYSDLADGRRQILAVHVPGDFVDLHSFQLKVMDHSVRALTRCHVAVAPHDRLTEITEHWPHLTRQLWLSTLIDSAILRRWLVGIGRRTAMENVAHLFCELYYRLRAVDLAPDAAFQLPLSQVEIGDLLGLSPVHVNRVLQNLRAQGVISFKGRDAEILQLARLEQICEFDPTYLHLPKPGSEAG